MKQPFAGIDGARKSGAPTQDLRASTHRTEGGRLDSGIPGGSFANTGFRGLRKRDRLIPAIVSAALLAIVFIVGRSNAHESRWDRGGSTEFAMLIPALVPFQLRPEITDRVDYWMERYTTDRRRDMEIFLSREGQFGGMIRSALSARGMPEELLYLAMIESGFSTTARSAVSARGVWQFMGPTAVQYGLRMDEWVDERLDPVRATDAALDYLEALHERFGSWYLAAAAYNAGPNRVASLLRRVDRDADGGLQRAEEDLYWEIVERLPRETREYVPKLIASMMLAKQQDLHGLEVESAEPYRYDRVWVPGGTSLMQLASTLSLDPTAIRDLNPHLILRRTPPGEPFALRVPPGQTQRVVSALDPVRSTRTKAVN